MLGGFLEIHGIPSHSPAASHSTHDGGAREQVVRRRPRRSATRWRWRCASGSGGWRRVFRSGSCCPACRQAEKCLSHDTCRGASPFRDLVNPTGAWPPQTTRRGHRVAEQLLRAHRRPRWPPLEEEVLVHLVEIHHKLGNLPKYLLLHDGHTRPVRAPPPGLAADIPSGGLELELLQEIPVI